MRSASDVPSIVVDGRRHAWRSLALLVALVVAVVFVSLSGSSVLDTFVVVFMINVVLVVALQTFVGNSGVFSFGHVAFMAIGAYTTAVFRIPANTKSVLFTALPEIQLDSVTAILVGGAAAAAVAALVGYPLMRLSGLVAGLATFALLNITFIVASNLTKVTGGSTGVAGIPETTTPIVGCLWAVGSVVVAWGFTRTTICLRLRAAREDEVAARATGIGVAVERYAAFVLSALIAGVAGGMFAQFYGSFNPQAFFVTATFAAVAMLVVGGSRSLSGAVVGTVFVSVVTEVLRRVEKGFDRPGLSALGVACALLAVLLLKPKGLTGGRELAFPSFGRGSRRRQPSSEPIDHTTHAELEVAS